MRKKTTMLSYILFGLFIFGFIILVLCWINIGEPKTPATSEQVWNVLVEQGHKPQDITQKFLEGNPNSDLIKNIAIEEDDFRFDFYVFNSENSAVDIYGQAHSLIVRTKNAYPNIEYDQKEANYCVYTLTAKGEYNVAIYVGNTAEYAYRKEENANKISKILSEIGYFESSSNDEEDKATVENKKASTNTINSKAKTENTRTIWHCAKT